MATSDLSAPLIDASVGPAASPEEHHVGPLYTSKDVPDTHNLQPQHIGNMQQFAPFTMSTNHVSKTTQLSLITWKNYKIQIARKKCGFCCKMCCPLFFILIMGFVGLARSFMTMSINCGEGAPCPVIDIAPTEYNIITADSLSINNQYSWIPQLVCSNTDALESNSSDSQNIPAYLGVVFNQNTQPQAAHILAIIAQHYGSGTRSIATSCASFAADTTKLNFTQHSLLKYFTTESELNAYIRNDKYAAAGYNFANTNADAWRPIAAAIVFKSISTDTLQWDYSLRFNTSVVPDTFANNERNIVNRFQRDGNYLVNNVYQYEWFTLLQSSIDNAITEYIANISEVSLDQMYVRNYNKGFFIFPFAYYEVDIYWSSMQYPFIVFVSLMFIYPILQIISTLVTEKANKIKEGMKMMGATSSMYWSSMYLWFCMEFTIICAFVTGFGFLMNVFLYSASSVIILWFWLFCMSQMAFSTLISTFFDNPKTATIVGFVLYFMCIALGVLMDSMNKTQKQLLCLLATPCMMSSIPILVEYENALIGVQWQNVTDETSQFSFATALIMMFIDCILYILLTLYLDNVWPSRFGQKESVFFCLFPSYWRKSKNSEEKHSNIETLSVEELNHYEKYDNHNESVAPVISIRNLAKTFHTYNVFSDAKKVDAVKGVSLDIYPGEIFCLLGHNGAGKTTTINMLCGLLSSSKGNAWIHGHDINENMNSIRCLLGVCPQHDILWNVLTAEEHLRFFGKLKGIQAAQLEHEVNRVINLFNMLDSGLWGKYPPNMSGGEKRRLSLAIALIGGSKVVYLDEPTSGMDPENRRKVWDIIQKEKQNRCMILTTHYMDEADTLGDRIAIMADGVIKCCGSSLYLKRLYGVGYTFTVCLNESDHENRVKPKIDDILCNIDGTKTISVAATEIMYRLPFKSSAQFANIFKTLDKSKTELNIKTFGISVTTLEEVFLRIGSDNKAASDDSMMQLEDSKNPEDEEEKYGVSVEHEEDHLQFEYEQDDINAFKLDERNAIWICVVHIYAILYKRFWWSVRDIKSILCQIILPVVLCGLIFGATAPIQIEQIDLELIAKQFTPEYTNKVIVPLTKLQAAADNMENNTVSNIFYTEDWDIFYTQHMSDIYGANVSYSIDTNTASDTSSFQREIYSNHKNPNTIPYHAFFFIPTQNEVLLGANASAYHSLPIALNVWNNWVLKYKVAKSAQINIYSHPLPITKQQESNVHQGNSFSATMWLMIAFTLIPASSIYFIVNEKTIGTKHQQYVSGISVFSYWCGTYLSDILLGSPACCLVLAAVYIFNFELLKGDALIPFFITLMLFVSSSISAGYLLHFCFRSAGKAQFITILFNVLLGVVLLTIYNSIKQFAQAAKTIKKFKAIASILPVFLLGDNMLLITNKAFDDPNKSHFELIQTNLFCMIAESIGYFTLTLLIEYAQSFPSILARFGFVVDQPKKLTRLDDDVLDEQHRIQTLARDEDELSSAKDVVVLNGLRKVYRGENKFSPYKAAVRDMHFGVSQGEVFGFLGVNGAGKTSTLQMLTGQKYPSSGTASVAGYDLNNQLNIRRIIGFCPQNDALFDLLTASEHLNFYGLLKGLNGNELKKQRKMLLRALSLNKYENRTSSTYSGGNKRKLCVAQALIGNPPVVFLDEPSTGMDPVSRRFMWKFISATMKGRCVILTTHSMDECEALCDRVGIMVAGQLSCIGSPQHLKSKFGKGFQLDITLDTLLHEQNENRIYQILEQLNETFPTSIIQQNGNKFLLEIRQYQVIEKANQNLSTLGEMFKMMEEFQTKYDIISYSLSQTSLEQVFLKMAKNEGVVDENQNENINDEQEMLLKEIEHETKDELIQRIMVLNRDHLQQILQNEIRNSSPYIVRALNVNNK